MMDLCWDLSTDLIGMILMIGINLGILTGICVRISQMIVSLGCHWDVFIGMILEILIRQHPVCLVDWLIG